ncbi:hypothetical protein ACIGBH_41400 [Streptomyces sp. NPDC085929]|uniref:hypothetical protein n=1 Tax=Streptomyces sp. NPDC085929 TaxID=3365739 RepID=UPI0037D2F92E
MAAQKGRLTATGLGKKHPDPSFVSPTGEDRLGRNWGADPDPDPGRGGETRAAVGVFGQVGTLVAGSLEYVDLGQRSQGAVVTEAGVGVVIGGEPGGTQIAAQSPIGVLP